MCSLAGDVLQVEALPRGANKKLLEIKCKKCDSASGCVVLRNKDIYCRACFLAAAVHKFRAVLGKHRIIKPLEKVLVVYKPGHPSTALLHLIRDGIDQSEHKKLKFQPVILYIDEHSKLPVQKRLEICANVYKEIAALQLTGHVTSLQNFIANFDQPPLCARLDGDVDKNLFQPSAVSYADLTQSDDVMNVSRRQLIIRAAKLFNCKAVLSPEISLDVAVGLLADISLGRGSQVSINEGIIDDRDKDVKILQPLRYFDMKEIAFYNVYNGIEPVSVVNPIEKVSMSVQNVMTKFVRDLQVNFPSTITTVVRTGDKLHCAKTDSTCAVCKAPIEKAVELSSAEATDFSHWVSTNQTTTTSAMDFNGQTKLNKFCFACSKFVNIVGEKYFLT